jgi:hypothetical protein
MDSPFLVWRERDANEAEVECHVLPGIRPAVVWHRDGKVEGVQEFERLEDALRLAQELRLCLLLPIG